MILGEQVFRLYPIITRQPILNDDSNHVYPRFEYAVCVIQVKSLKRN